MRKVNFKKKSSTFHWEISISCATQKYDATTPYYPISALLSFKWTRLRGVKNKIKLIWGFDLETFSILETGCWGEEVTTWGSTAWTIQLNIIEIWTQNWKEHKFSGTSKNFEHAKFVLFIKNSMTIFYSSASSQKMLFHLPLLRKIKPEFLMKWKLH